MLPIQALGLLTGTTLGVSGVLFLCISGILVVMIILALLAVLVSLLSRGVRLMEKILNKGKPETAAPEKASSVPELPDSISQGSLKLVDTDEQTAAMIMAIISNESGIPLNKLIFKSIKKIDAETATE